MPRDEVPHGAESVRVALSSQQQEYPGELPELGFVGHVLYTLTCTRTHAHARAHICAHVPVHAYKYEGIQA